MKTVAALIAALAFALPLSADFCDLNLRLEGGQLRWNAVVGATNYTVFENFGSLRAPIYVSTQNTFLPVTSRASGPVNVRFVVTAEIQPGVRILPGQPVTQAEAVDGCVGYLDVVLPADAEFRKLTRKAVVPLVGSTTGDFGARFRTSLEMRGAASQHGRLVFHPAFRPAADSDPSIPYSFATTRVIHFDDVVESMGQQGIGSLDIIPDDDAPDRLPDVQARFFSESAQGTFGTFSRAVLPSEYLAPAGFDVRIPTDSRFRVNIGLRTLTATTVQTIVSNADGRPAGLKNLTFPAGWMEMQSASAFMGRALEPGQTVSLSFFGAVIAFYTITENGTNDPTLILGPSRATPVDLGKLVD